MGRTTVIAISVLFLQCAFIQLAIVVLSGFYWANLIHGATFSLFLLLSISVIKSMVTWAVFPYSNNLVAYMHQKDVNKRLCHEISDLVSHFLRIVITYMKQDENSKLSQQEYRECAAVISKVNDMLNLFVSVNQKLQTPSKQIRISTILMQRVLGFVAKVKLVSRFDLSGRPKKTIQEHFIESTEKDRLEVDSLILQSSPLNSNQREYYLPIIPAVDWDCIKELEETVEELLKLCEKSVKPIRTCGKKNKRSNCGCFARVIFGEPKQMGLVLGKTFDGEQRYIKSENIMIDAMFFTATGEKLDDLNELAEYKDRNTFILCNPNAMFYQHMINFPHAFYLRFFLQKGFNVLVWNYRGYGLTKARNCCFKMQNSPSPRKFKLDSEAILRYLRSTLGVRGKIGVYGRSLGGISTSHLAKFVDMIIVDRSFSSLYDVADRKFFGKAAVDLLRFASGGWRSNSDFDFTQTDRDLKYGAQSQSCYKVLTCDTNDEIIELHSSLMVGVARQLCLKQNQTRRCLLDDSEILQLIKALKFVVDVEDRLYRFINSVMSDEIERETLPSRQPNVLQLEVVTRSQTQPTPTRSDTLPKIKMNQVVDASQLRSSEKELKFKRKKAQAKLNLQNLFLSKGIQFKIFETDPQNVFETDRDPPINLELITLQILLGKVLNEVLQIKAANVFLHEIISLSKPSKVEMVRNFLYLLEIYGHQFPLNYFDPKIYSLEMQRTRTMNELSVIANRLKVLIEGMSCLAGPIKDSCIVLNEIIDRVATTYRQKNSSDQENPQNDLQAQIPKTKNRQPMVKSLSEPKEIEAGYLINLSVGHTNRPTDAEMMMFTLHLKAAGFIQNYNSVDKKQAIPEANEMRPNSIQTSAVQSSESQKTLLNNQQTPKQTSFLPPIKVNAVSEVQPDEEVQSSIRKETILSDYQTEKINSLNRDEVQDIMIVSQGFEEHQSL